MAEEKRQSDRIRLWVWRGAGVFIVIVFFVARFLMRDRLLIREVQVHHQELVSTVPTNGHVEPDVNYQYHSPLAGLVKTVNVHPGDVVPAGKLLIQLDDLQARARMATAESGVKAAQAVMDSITHNGTLQERQASAADIARSQLESDQAHHDLDALIKLNSTGAASASEVSAARERVATADAGLHAAQQSQQSRYSPADVARAQAALADAEANLAAARAVVAQSSYYAPITGTVYSLDAGPTDFVEEGKLLLQMADLHHEHVIAYFDEPWIGQLAVGQKILIKWDAKPGKEWHGHIVRTPSTVKVYAGTRNIGEALVQIDDGDGDLLPDTNVTVTVTTSSEPNALSLPREALHSQNGKSYVFKVVGNSLVRTPVTIGSLNLTQVAITSGLNEGDWVATGTTTGAPLQEGVPVKKVGP
jgi:HlyD family secretion protein